MKKAAFVSLFLPALPASAGSIWKANNSNAYESGTAWIGGVAPGPGDVAVFDSFLTQQSPRSLLGVDASWSGVLVTASAPVGCAVGKPVTSDVVLSLGSAGIDIQGLTRGAGFSVDVLLTADQTWTSLGTTPASGVGFAGTGRAGGSFVDFGGHRVTKTGAGPLAFNSNNTASYTLRNGTLVVDGGEVTVSSSNPTTSVSPIPYLTVGPDMTFQLNAGSALRPFNRMSEVKNLLWSPRVILNGGTFAVAGYLGFFPGSATSFDSDIGGIIEVTGGGVLEIPNTITLDSAEHTVSAALTGSGSVSLRNSSSAAADHRMTLTGDNSAFTGSVSVSASEGRRTVRLGSALSGSAGSPWSISTGNVLELAAPSVSLGTLIGAGTVKAPAGSSCVLTLGGAAFTATSTFPGSVTNDAGGALTVRKQGPGTQNLTGSLSWSGDTIVEGGVLGVFSAALADVSTVRISGAALRLGHSLTDSVSYLYLDGVAQPAGIYGPLGSGAAHETARLTGTGKLQVTVGSGSVYGQWINGFSSLTDGASRLPEADADGDGTQNLAEFAFAGSPDSGADAGRVRKISAGGAPGLVLPVRTGAVFSGSGELVSAPVDGIVYHIQATHDLVDFTTPSVVEITPWTPEPGTPALPAGWVYRAFRAAVPGNRAMLRALVSPAP